MIWTAFGQVLPQAVGIAISPIPVILVILMLTSPAGRRNGVVFAVAWTVAVLAVATIAYGVSTGADVATDAGAADAGHAVEVVLGVLLALLAVRQWRRRPRTEAEANTPPKVFDAVDGLSLPKVLGLAVLFGAVKPKNLLLAVSAGVGVAEAGATGGHGVTAVALFALVASVTILGPTMGVLVLGARTARPLEVLKAWLIRNTSTILIVLLTVLSAKLLGSGLALAG